MVVIYAAGFHIPFIANYIQQKIKSGMTADEVESILKNQKISRHYESCQITINNENKDYFSSCLEKINDLSRAKTNFTAEVSITFMGPAFIHNDFTITFNKEGKVEAVSSAKHWD